MTRSKCGWLATAVTAAAFVLASVFVAAQFRAAIQGVVTDQTGAVLPGADVTLTSQETGVARQTVTGDEGLYRFSGLAPGLYTLSVALDGFQTETVQDLAVGAETTRGVNISLKLPTQEQTVTVVGSTLSSLQTESSDVARGLTNEEILELPQAGRDPYELLRLTPGVFGDGARGGNGGSVGLPNAVGPGGSNTSVFQVENQVQITANGQRVSANDFKIDGVSVNSLGWGGAAVVTPNQESVKEIRVLSSAYSAEAGRNSGAQVQVVSKNGTNNFHGSAFFKFQDPGLNAFNKYGGPGGPPVRVNQRFRQFGGSVGGPILKERLFFFFSYEGVRSNNTDFFNQYVETPEYRQLVQQIRPGGVTAQVLSAPGIEPRIVSVLPMGCSAFGNDPNRCQAVPGGLDIGSPTGALGQYISLGNPVGGGLDGIPDIQFAQLALPGRIRGDQFNTRVDYNWRDNSFAVSTYFTRRNDEQSDAAGRSRPIGDLVFKPLNSAATILWNRVVSPTALNEARFNLTRFAFNQVESSQGTNFGIPRIEVEGLPFDRIRFGAPRSETTPAVFAQNTFEFSDTYSKFIGGHGLKFGVDVRWEQDNNNLVGGARPIYSFVGLFNLANDAPIFEAINADPVTGAVADSQRYFRTRNYALFVQDDWKVRSNLTVNLGLRWEYFTPLREAEGRLTNLEFGPNGLIDSRVVPAEEYFQPDRNNFGPRLGFSWSPGRFDNQFVLRGGFGIAYNRNFNNLYSNTRGNPPFLVRYNICCGTAEQDFGSPFVNGQIQYVLGANSSPFSYPANSELATGIDPVSGGPADRSAEIYGTPREVPNPYVYFYSLDADFLLPAKLTATIGYQGSSSHKLVRTVNQNFLYDPNPRFFAVYFALPDVNSNYHAMNFRLNRRFDRGFQTDFIYRWSKSIDTGSGEFGFQTNQTYPLDLASERGPSDFDVKHHVVWSTLWELPIFRNRNDFVGKAFGGWKVNSILTGHTGFPWTPVTGIPLSIPGLSPTRPTAQLQQPLQDSSNGAFIRPGGNFPGGGPQYFDIANSGPPGIGRNSQRGPHYFAVDFSFVKSTPIPVLGEEARIDFRANFFNAFNNLNLEPFGFGTGSTRIEDAFFFGRSAAGQAGRVIEFQARLNF